MIVQDLSDQIENLENEISDKTGTKEANTETRAEDKKRLGGTTADLDDDVLTLKDLETECFEKSESFKEKQELRKQEIAAIGKAMEIMSSDDVSGNADKHLPGFLQTSFAQLRTSSPSDESRKAAVEFLRHQGLEMHSNVLSMIAQKASSDPFAKVKKMIDSMITKLTEEAGSESEQKGFCDKELGTNEKTRTKLTEDIDGLQAKLDDGDASLIEISDTTATLAKEINDLQQAISEATDLRGAEKSKNIKTIEDAKAAAQACKAAMQVLKDFYDKAGEATAFFQVKQRKGPFDVSSRPKMGTEEWKALANPNYEDQAGGAVDKGHTKDMQTFGDTYQGDTGRAGGVLGMMEVIMSDFASLAADTTAAEAEATKSYADLMTQSKKSVATKSKETEMLTSDKVQLEQQMVEGKRDFASSQDQLLAAARYYDKLKPQCVNTGVSYSDRVKRRNEEIQSLKEALTILEGQV